MQVTLKTTQYCGDHSREVAIAIDVDPETTVFELMHLVFEKGIEDNGATRVANKLDDHLELRMEHFLK